MKANRIDHFRPLLGLVLGLGIGLLAGCDLEPAPFSVSSCDSDTDAPGSENDLDSGFESSDQDSVDCQVELDSCLSTCSAGLCAGGGNADDAGIAFEDCTKSCYRSFGSCSGGWKPSSCDQSLEDCLTECAPYYPRDPTSAWPDECVAACYAKQEECTGKNFAACQSDVDCAPQEVCAWSADNCPALTDCEGAEGLCVPRLPSGSCEMELTWCLASCAEGALCDEDGLVDASSSNDCVTSCYDVYDACEGKVDEDYSGCTSDLDCSPGSSCYFETADCDPQTGQCPPSMGTCVYDCDTAVVECLDGCAASFDCTDGSTDCTQSTPDNNRTSCENDCWAGYDDCLYPTNDCDIEYGSCLSACPAVCDENGCSPEAQCATLCDSGYSDCLDAG
ncbi:MAG: hypothetical protein MUC50_22850 [Myxococcota bacterium]|jgi:hypothetical protein|nr:hypothetical protein [Myxococcota bacterium]